MAHIHTEVGLFKTRLTQLGLCLDSKKLDLKLDSILFESGLCMYLFNSTQLEA